MALSGTVADASPGLIGFDHNSRVNAAQARTFASRGFKFCIRYVSRDDAGRAANEKNGNPDLSEAEGQIILDAGMALMTVQHVARKGWSPSAALGKSYGENAAAYTSEAGVPAGVCVWLDLEGIKVGTPDADTIDYCNAWFLAVTTAGYVPGVYLGFDVFLSPDQLYFDLTTKHYWRADGNIPDVAHRGYQLIQNIQHPNTPQEFDRDVTKVDNFSGTVIWLE